MPTGLTCTQFDIQHFADFGYNSACEYVRTACAEETIRVDFFDLYYCTFNQSFALFIPFSALFLFITFYVISSTAENYLEPVLSKIAKSLGFSESLAGVTLVGLANGAPDVFAALAAGSKPNGGILIPLGGLLGAAIFTTSIIFSACIMFSPSKAIIPDKRALKRDCMFYMLLLLYIVALGLIGEITLLGSLGFFLQYAIFIGVVIHQETKYRKERNDKIPQDEDIGIQCEPEFTLKYHLEQESEKVDLTKFLLPEDHIKKNEEAVISEHLDPLNVTMDDSTIVSRTKTGLQRSKSNVYYRLRHKIWQEFKEIERQSLFWKTVYVLLYPVKLVRSLTVPAPSVGEWDKSKAIIQPFTVSLFLLWQLDLTNILNNHMMLVIYIFTCLTLSILIWKFASASEIPKGASGILMRSVAFVASIMWINFLANAIVDFISLVAIFTGLPLNYLSLTLLCYGNSTSDFFVDVSLTKKGYDKTAVSGVFAGQYFNLAIGFGASLTRQILANGPKAFSLVPNGTASVINLVLIGCILANLVAVILWGQKTNFKFKKDFSVYSFSLYACFLIFVTFLLF